ncbi:hypothetical protein NE865_11298 [Phthorimaea operculella]|nr:hypothetical protein NE865_11298 [Phthorimaea operculella]
MGGHRRIVLLVLAIAALDVVTSTNIKDKVLNIPEKIINIYQNHKNKPASTTPASIQAQSQLQIKTKDSSSQDRITRDSSLETSKGTTKGLPIKSMVDFKEQVNKLEVIKPHPQPSQPTFPSSSSGNYQSSSQTTGQYQGSSSTQQISGQYQGSDGAFQIVSQSGGNKGPTTNGTGPTCICQAWTKPETEEPKDHKSEKPKEASTPSTTHQPPLRSALMRL